MFLIESLHGLTAKKCIDGGCRGPSVGKLRMLGFDLQLSPGEGSFVTQEGDGVGIFGDGLALASV